MKSKIACRIESYYKLEMYGDLENPELMRLLDLAVATTRPMHDIANALKWSVAQLCDAQLLSDFYLANGSLRNTFSAIEKKLLGYILRCKVKDPADVVSVT